MANSRVSSPPQSPDHEAIEAGIITRIHLENFMCHSSLDIEFGEHINFITGQNGSGKSAILTALCVAFGCRARGTQRANTLKDFIKTGCSYALVQVEIKNQGPEPYKADIYGDIIVVERRITESTSSITLRNHQGRRVGMKREDLYEVIEHFNIHVGNPCVIMSQDKSREFLNSGSAKDKYKFFYEATSLRRVDDLLKGIDAQLRDAAAQVNYLEESLKPVVKAQHELQQKIKSMEFVEKIGLKKLMVWKKLAWALVYDAQRKLDEKSKEINELEGRISGYQTQIDDQHNKFEALSDQLAEKKSEVLILVDKTSEVKRRSDELQHNYSVARHEKRVLEEDHVSKTRQIQNMHKDIESLEQQIHQFHEQQIRDTEAEKNEIEEKLRELKVEFDEAEEYCQRLKAEEEKIQEEKASIEREIKIISEEIRNADKQYDDSQRSILDFEKHITNKVTAFGRDKVISLLKAIEDNKHKFRYPPIGPVGSHLTLEKGEWSIAVESAVGRFLNSFIVTDLNDFHTLRELARTVKYTKLHIVIYNFSRKRLEIPQHMLPQTHHPTVFSVLHTDNDVVHNVLIDVGNTEQQVLVSDYDVGKTVVFHPRIQNVKEVYTYDGTRMFQRGSAQTILFPSRKIEGRLCASYDEKIKKLESDKSSFRKEADEGKKRKRGKEKVLNDLQQRSSKLESSRKGEERKMMSINFDQEDLRTSLSAVAATAPTSDSDELRQKISKLHEEIQEEQTLLEKLEKRIDEAECKAEDLKVSVNDLRESAKLEIDELSAAENEIEMIDEALHDAEGTKNKYQGLIDNEAVPMLKKAETEYGKLQNLLKDYHQRASNTCPQSESDALGCKESNPEQLRAEYDKLSERLDYESGRFPECLEELRMMFEKKQRKISRKQQTYETLKQKLHILEKSLEVRWNKFNHVARELIKQLTWGFNGHLRKKGIRGEIKVNAEEQTLAIEVIMPQDPSNKTIRDTRGLSGGERSFSTLCFALTLHGMTEAPFRAMDEFDVFMDAVSRKISLDALVDFALEKRSQWIFITPHDISKVKNHERIKKQQMAAPRG